MRLDSEGQPLVHRVQSEYEVMRDARIGLDALLKRAEVERENAHARTIREKAAQALEDDLESLRKRRLAQASAIAERFAWEPVASVAFFEAQTCQGCGKFHYQFRGFATKMKRKADAITRLVSASCLDQGLPFERVLMPASVPVCIECLEGYVQRTAVPSHEFTPNRRPGAQD